MNTQHSQGEWDVNEFTDLDGDHHITVVLYSNGCPIADLSEMGKETRPNARLIAAAPELLAACIEFVRKCDAGEAKSTRSYAQMVSAIAKATQF